MSIFRTCSVLCTEFSPLPAHVYLCSNWTPPLRSFCGRRRTVWGQNFMSKWKPVNGLCLAWPSAAKIVDSRADPHSEFGVSSLLNNMEMALNLSMQPNLWPSMNGGGVEQVGATQAVNDLLVQSVHGAIRLFPGYERGADIAFNTIRTPGAFLVSAKRSSIGVLSSVRIMSEAGGKCSLHSSSTGAAAAAAAAAAALGGTGTGTEEVGKWPPSVTNAATGVAIKVTCAGDACEWPTLAGTEYAVGL